MFRELWRQRDHRVPSHRRIDEHGRPSVSDIAERIHSQETLWWKLYAVELKDTGGVLGYCGLVENSVDGLEEPELAFEILQGFQGRGFATEAASEIIAWADSVGMSHLWATVWDWNVASQRVLEKLGFATTGRTTAVSEHGSSLLMVRESRGTPP